MFQNYLLFEGRCFWCTWLGLGWAGGDFLLVTSTVGKGAEDILQGVLQKALGLLVHLQRGERWWLLRLGLHQRPLSQGGYCAEQHQGGHQGNVHLKHSMYCC